MGRKATVFGNIILVDVMGERLNLIVGGLVLGEVINVKYFFRRHSDVAANWTMCIFSLGRE
jgi:hypothetical protein